MRKPSCETPREHDEMRLLLSLHAQEKSLAELRADSGSRLTGAAASGGAAGIGFTPPSFLLVSYSRIPRRLCNRNKNSSLQFVVETRIQR